MPTLLSSYQRGIGRLSNEDQWGEYSPSLVETNKHNSTRNTPRKRTFVKNIFFKLRSFRKNERKKKSFRLIISFLQRLDKTRERERDQDTKNGYMIIIFVLIVRGSMRSSRIKRSISTLSSIDSLIMKEKAAANSSISVYHSPEKGFLRWFQ